MARNEAGDNEMAGHRGPMNCLKEFGYFPKGSRKALSCLKAVEN